METSNSTELDSMVSNVIALVEAVNNNYPPPVGLKHIREESLWGVSWSLF